MHITCTKSTVNLKLIANLIVSPETSTLSMASSYLTTESGCSRIEAAMYCLCAVSDGMVSIARRLMNFNSYLQI
jgi:hypothetical protein